MTRNLYSFLFVALMGIILVSCDVNKRAFIKGYQVKKTNFKSSPSYEEATEALAEKKTDVIENEGNTPTANNQEEAVTAYTETLSALTEEPTQDYASLADDMAVVAHPVKRTPALQHAINNSPKNSTPTPEVREKKTENTQHESNDVPPILPTAIIGLSLGALSVFTLTFGMIFGLALYATPVFWIGLLVGGAMAIVGLILSVISLTKISRHRGEYAGKGAAITGIILSGIGLFIFFIMSIVGVAVFIA